MSNITLYKPINSWHDTARMLYDMWEEANLVTIKKIDGCLTWLNNVGDVLLYDHPLLNNCPSKFNIGLFGNTQYSSLNAYPWIFWPRDPLFLEYFLSNYTIKSFSKRYYKSIFLGKIENTEQLNNRKGNWHDVIDLFKMPITQGKPTFDMRTYLILLGSSKYGLALPGFGPKCNREIELMSLGTVPIFTKGVETRYYNKLEEDIHYIYVDSPEDIKGKIDSISEKQWKTMSKNCLEWYYKNCTRYSSFDTTMEILKNVS
jgi:hypothetical protein